MDPIQTLEEMNAKYSPDFDAYASGKLDASALRCLLCGLAPCECPPFGSDEYMALVNKLHGKTHCPSCKPHGRSA